MAKLKNTTVTDTLTWNDGVVSSYGYIGVRTQGTATTQGISTINIGNSLATGVAGNARGRVLLYGTTEKYGILYGPDSANINLYMPEVSGTIVTQQTKGTAVGSGSNPVYIASNGRVTAGRNNWAGTTDITITKATNITEPSAWVYYSRSSGLGIIRMYGVYTPTAAYSAGTTVKVAQLSYADATMKPDVSYFGVMYRGVTGASRFGNAWVNSDGEVQVKFAADLTKGTAYGFYLTVPFRSDDAAPL